jgi:hypothetical protein
MRDAVVDIRIRTARADAFAKKTLKTAARFATHRRSREHGRHIHGGGGGPSTRFRSAFAGAKKICGGRPISRRNTRFARNRAPAPTFDETR